MAEFDPTQFGAVAVDEPQQAFDPIAHGAVPIQEEQPKKEGGVVSGILSGLGHALNPINIVKGALDIGQPSDISNIIRYGKTLGEIVTGTKPDVAIGQNIPELQQQREAVYGKLGTKEQASALTGIGLQLGLTALPFLHGKTLTNAPLAEVAEPLLGKKAPATPMEAAVEVPTTETATQPGQFTTTVEATADQAARNLEGQFADLRTQAEDLQSRINAQRTAASSAPIPPEQVAVNQEIAPVTEPPSATAEPFPSISASAEEARRTELQQEPPKVREAISLDEIRLMRERDELQSQNEIAQKATGTTHPAVDERLGQIDEELTNIANTELQKAAVEQKPREPEGIQNASQIEEPTSPNGSLRTRGGVEELPTGNVEEANARLRSDQGIQTSEARQGTEAGQITPPTEPTTPTGISNQRLTEAYGDSAPVATTGKGPGAWKDEGLSRLDNFQKTGDVKNDPYSVLTNLREGKVPVSQLPSDVSLLRAEHQRLLEDARRSEGTPEYQAKSQAALDMATAIKGVAHGPASDVFRALQEYDKPRYDNVTDFDQALRERENRESTPQEKVQFNKISKDVTTTRNGAEEAINGAQKRLGKLPRMSFEEAAKSIHDQISELTKDCVL